jgi:hypothetical protein
MGTFSRGGYHRWLFGQEGADYKKNLLRMCGIRRGGCPVEGIEAGQAQAMQPAFTSGVGG